MREILFRGKRLCDGKWTYGSLIKFDGQDIIFAYEGGSRGAYDVHQNTVGQYVGLSDRNDTKIFEGDIVSVFVSPVGSAYFQSAYGVVEWHNGMIYVNTGARHLMTDFDEMTVVGNIHDQPELLEVR